MNNREVEKRTATINYNVKETKKSREPSFQSRLLELGRFLLPMSIENVQLNELRSAVFIRSDFIARLCAPMNTQIFYA